MNITRLSTVEGAREATGLTVIIDVFRAFTTDAFVMANGAETIHPVLTVEEARELRRLHPDWLLMGEREGIKVDGFDLGNSPLEYTSEAVKGKTLIFSTSNGTVAITRSAAAKEIVLGCFLNLDAVAAHIVSGRAKKVAVLCAGDLEQLSLEDFVCGGCIVDRIVAGTRAQTVLNDGAVAARTLANTTGDVGEVVRNSSHGLHLAELGFGDDLEFCSRVNEFRTAPVVIDGRISLQTPHRR